ncbi:MAG TPA: PstS family phosphate ABC transporter substrate-binding protein [Xanthomonadales bacterium]|nr:PstS family phosphate ABC transporter substrate-binding protein [Xanthomonadales bacterium]
MIQTNSFLLPAMLVLALVCHAPVWAQQQPAVPTDSNEYTAIGELEGELASTGSDSLANLMTLWAETFKRLYPRVTINIKSTGSATAPPALALGSADIGPMSRLMNEQEIHEFETALGYKPVPFAVAIDALAVFVHPDNPLEGLSLQQLDAAFALKPSCGAGESIRTWGQLGLQGEWSAAAIELFGRNSISGTYQHFKRHALCDGNFRDDVTELPGSASLIRAVSQSRLGMGYSALGYADDSVRILPLARTAGQEFVAATQDNAINGSYPLARLLYIYVNHNPEQPWNPLQQEFIRMVLARQGQEQVVRDGFAALPPAVARRELQKLATAPGSP